MKKLAFLLIGLIITIQTTAQSDEPCETCLPEGIEFTTQSQIDDFQTTFPNCTEILGNVSISGDFITNVNGLNVLTSIGGSLYIRYNNTLTSLTGLENVTSIGWSLIIGSNDALTSLTGLENVPSIGGDLDIWGNNALTSLTGLTNITSIGGSLYIRDNNTLTSLTGLANMTSFGGSLYIRDNDALTSLTGLENVTSIGVELQIWDNNALTSLTGIDNINPASIKNMVIEYNISLSECDVLSVCEYLASLNGYIHIEYNAIGCNSPEEVQDSCEANAGNLDEQYIKDNLVLYPNPAQKKLNVSAEGLTIDEMNIYTLTGQQVLMIRPKGETIDISNLQTGMYIVEVAIDSRKIRKKLLVQR